MERKSVFRRLLMGQKSDSLPADATLVQGDDCGLVGLIAVPLGLVAFHVDSVTFSSTTCVESACCVPPGSAAVRVDSVIVLTDYYRGLVP